MFGNKSVSIIAAIVGLLVGLLVPMMQLHAASPVFFPAGLDSKPTDINITDDGKIALMATSASVTLWDIDAKKILKIIGTDAVPARSPAMIDPMGKYVIALSNNHKYAVWDVSSGEVLGSTGDNVFGFALSQDGSTLFARSNPSGDYVAFNVDIYSIPSLSLVGTVEHVRLFNWINGVGAVGMSNSGSLVRINPDGSTDILVDRMQSVLDRIKAETHAESVDFITMSDKETMLFAAYHKGPEEAPTVRPWNFVTMRSGKTKEDPKLFTPVKSISNIADPSIWFGDFKYSGARLFSNGYIYNWESEQFEFQTTDVGKLNQYVATYGASHSGRYILFSSLEELAIYDADDRFKKYSISRSGLSITFPVLDSRDGSALYAINDNNPDSGPKSTTLEKIDIESGKSLAQCTVSGGAILTNREDGSIEGYIHKGGNADECEKSLNVEFLSFPQADIDQEGQNCSLINANIVSCTSMTDKYLSYTIATPASLPFSVGMHAKTHDSIAYAIDNANKTIVRADPFYVLKAIYSPSIGRIIVADSGGNIDLYDARTGELWGSVGACTVGDLQVKLSTLKYNTGKPDGKLGSKTLRAVHSYLSKTMHANGGLPFTELTDESVIHLACTALGLNARSKFDKATISADGKVLAYQRAVDGTINTFVRVISTDTLEVIDDMDLGPAALVGSISLSSDGRQLAVGLSDGSIRFRNVYNHDDEFALTGLGGQPGELLFPSSALRFFSAMVDGQLVLIDVQKRKEAFRIARAADGKLIYITPAGYFAAFNGGEELLQVAYGNRALGIENAYDVLSRPDLVFAHIKGDDAAYVEAARKLDIASLFENNLPPTITKTELAPSPSKDGTFAAQAEIEARSGGVGKVVFMVNGIAQGVVQQDGAKAGESVKVEKDLQLYDGDNKVEVVAYTSDGRIASNPFVVETKATVAAGKPRLHVAVVAVNDYDDPRNVLKYAVPDGRSISSVFRQLGSGIYSDTSSYFLLDKEVDKAQMETFFADIASKVRPSDIFVLFFAGHGVTENGQYYFIPADFRYRNESSIAADGVSQGDLQKWLSGIVAEKSIIMFDTCESGTLTNLDLSTRGLTEANAIEKLNRAVGRNVIAAASATEAAIEGYKGHGLFTYSFMEAAASGDRNGDHMVDLTEIIQFVDNRVPQIAMQAFGQMQIPQVRMQGANFPLMNAGTPDELAAAGDFIPSRNTHVIVKETAVFADSGLSEATGETLPPGTRVGIIKTEGKAVLLSRDGNRVGFVEAGGLVTLQ
jgi:WD40 repeat protein